jgi:hypothetical protein
MLVKAEKLVMQIKQHTFMHQQLEVKDTTDTQSSA